MITETARSVCADIPTTTTDKKITLSAGASAKLTGLAKKLADLGVEGAAAYTQSDTARALLESDILPAMKDQNACRLQVFDRLEKRLLTTVNAAPTARISQDQFFEVVRTGDIQSIRIYLENGGNVHANSDDRQLSVHLSRNTTSSVAVLNELRKYGLKIDYPFASRRTIGPQENRLLFWATASANLDLVRELIRLGATPNFETEVKTTGPTYKKSLLRLAEDLAADRDAKPENKAILEMLRKSGARLSPTEVLATKKPTPEEIASRISACEKEMRLTTEMEWISQATQFYSFNKNSYNLRETIIAQINANLLTGTITNKNQNTIISSIIKKQCRNFAQK